MYAVIATGGKQYRVQEGSVLRVEKLAAEPGAEVKFDEVLLVGAGDSVKVGTPKLAGAPFKMMAGLLAPWMTIWGKVCSCSGPLAQKQSQG